MAVAEARHGAGNDGPGGGGEGGQTQRPALQPGERAQFVLGVLQVGQDRRPGAPRAAAPASVSTAPWGTRRTSVVPTSASSVAICREIAGCVYPSASAAAEKDPWRATAVRTLSRRTSSMTNSYTP